MLKKITYLLLIVTSFGYSQNLPAGFTILEVADNLEAMTSFDFIDADTILLAQQSGEIYLFENGEVSSEPIVEIPTIISTVGGDRGLVAIKVDPDYPTSPYIYVTYTVEAATHNVVSRFIFENGDIDLSTEEILLELSPLPAIWHTGGAIVFDDQGHLFTTTGDNSTPSNAQDFNTTHGKVIRINKDGSIPVDNPYYGGPNIVDDIFWGIGLRNPFTMAIHKETNVIYVNDVGKFDAEEVNNATGIDRNFGWPDEEGYNELETSTYDQPSYAYIHPPGAPTDSTGYAITGGAFYDPETPIYPAVYVDKYFFMDYAARWINYVDPASNLEVGHHHHIHDLQSTRETFATNINESAISLNLSPDGYFYWLSRFNKKLYKLVFYDDDEPIILSYPEDTTTMVGESTAFEVIALGSPDLNYEWYKNGNLLGSAPNGSIYSWGNTVEAREGEYQVRVYNSFGEVWSPTWNLNVIPFNEAPEVNITLPIEGALYQAGETVQFEATGTDTEEGSLTGDRFTWFAVFHHDDHIHDGPAFATGVNSGEFVIPDFGESADNVWYEFIVRVEDALGQIAEDNVFIYPKKSTVTFVTNPPNLKVSIDGPNYDTPRDQLFVEFMNIPVSAPDYQVIDGVDPIYRLDNWSSNVTNDFLSVPEEDFTLTANFVACTFPDDVINFSYNFIRSPDQLEFLWNSTNTSCIKGFELENIDTGEIYYIDAYRDNDSYNYSIYNIDPDLVPNYNFRITSYNEYGNGNDVFLSFTLSDNDYTTRNFKLYPNPFRDFIILESNLLIDIQEFEMYNSIGVKMDITVNSIDEYKHKLKFDNLSTGIYYLKIKGENISTLKIVKD